MVDTGELKIHAIPLKCKETPYDGEALNISRLLQLQ